MLQRPHFPAARLGALLLLALVARAHGATAGILLEAQAGGQPLRLELGREQSRVLARLGDGARYLVDLGAGDVYRLDATPPQRLRAAAMPDPAPAPPGFALEQWSEGPLVAGNGSTYHVLIIDERICAEVLASPWMGPFTAPLVRAIELLQRVAPQLAPQPHEPCGKVGFAVYAGDGFPLMAAFKGEPLFEVTLLRFDHRPLDAAFALPAGTRDCGAKPAC